MTFLVIGYNAESGLLWWLLWNLSDTLNEQLLRWPILQMLDLAQQQLKKKKQQNLSIKDNIIWKNMIMASKDDKVRIMMCEPSTKTLYLYSWWYNPVQQDAQIKTEIFLMWTRAELRCQIAVTSNQHPYSQ